MSGYVLQLLEDRLEADSRFSPALPALKRVVYVVEGSIAIEAGTPVGPFAPNSAWFGTEPCAAQAGARGARLWRWELLETPAGDDGLAAGAGVESGLKQRDGIELDPQIEYLMRCDRVDFPLAGIAYTHTHAGPGTRCLLQGEIRVQVDDTESLIRPGESWFESGPDPVYAVASDSQLTSFVRVMILPRSLQGQSSISYVKPEDEDKPKTQQYTRFVDEFIELEL